MPRVVQRRGPFLVPRTLYGTARLEQYCVMCEYMVIDVLRVSSYVLPSPCSYLIRGVCIGAGVRNSPTRPTSMQVLVQIDSLRPYGMPGTDVGSGTVEAKLY
eukprot:656933-Rhodomonas_salina.1